MTELSTEVLIVGGGLGGVAAALAALDARELEPGPVDETLGVLLKYQDDIAKLRGAEAARLIAEAKQAAAA